MSVPPLAVVSEAVADFLRLYQGTLNSGSVSGGATGSSQVGLECDFILCLSSISWTSDCTACAATIAVIAQHLFHFSLQNVSGADNGGFELIHLNCDVRRPTLDGVRGRRWLFEAVTGSLHFHQVVLQLVVLLDEMIDLTRSAEGTGRPSPFAGSSFAWCGEDGHCHKISILVSFGEKALICLERAKQPRDLIITTN